MSLGIQKCISFHSENYISETASFQYIYITVSIVSGT